MFGEYFQRVQLHGGLYDSDCFTVMGHGFQGWSNIDNELYLIADKAKKSNKQCIELLICEIGQQRNFGINSPQKLHDISGIPIKFSEDYVLLPIFGIGKVRLIKSPTAKIHGWRWIK